jgi:hypothetical protein
LEQYAGQTHLPFLCDGHAGVVDGAHPIGRDERAELERRRKRSRGELAGLPWE